MDDAFNLKRFLDAQHTVGYGQTLDWYQTALKEIRAGRKASHWIWFIFPQLQGLGHSENSILYGISNLEEARAYLAEPTLRHNLLEISEALLAQETNDPVAVLSWSVDARKVCSCMTLFVLADESIPVFRQVLDKYYHGKMDGRTLRLLHMQ